MQFNDIFLLLFVFSIGVFCLYRLGNSGFGITLPSLFVIVAVFVQIIPGVILVSLFDAGMSYGVEQNISEVTKRTVFIYTLYSLFFLFLFIIIISYFLKISPVIKKTNVNDFKFFYLIYFFGVFIICLNIFSAGIPPIYYGLMGEHETAALKKALILTSEVGVGGFFIGYIVKFFPYVCFVYVYLCRDSKFISRYTYYVYLFFIIIFSIYDLQKYKLAYFILFYIAVWASYKGISFFRLIVLSSLGFFSLIIFFVISTNFDFKQAFIATLSRLFIGQTEGLYLIFEALSPDIERITYGLPLSSFFMPNTATDPAADVVRIFFPTADESWINSNTYVLAHAWSIFGDFSILIAPLVVSINLVIYIFFRMIYYRLIGNFSDYIYVVLIFNMPINNEFSYFFYFKSIIAFNSIGIIIFLLKKIRILLS
ncbi:hypothetical protein N5C12_16610, partial [Comamonas aquatica]|uniref:hypothetical protein n=1 Tax=Comamonas aquatica TaxID=225991 RepID=UPI00244D5B7E